MKQAVDPIIEEIHETRREIAKRFNYDIRQISDDARRRQEIEGRPMWRPESVNQPMHSGGSSATPDTGDTSHAAE